LKSKVVLALFLFLHLVAHPLVHAADGFFPTPGHTLSTSADSGNSADHECAVCHTSGSVTPAAPIATIGILSSSTALLIHVQEQALRDGVELHLPSRAPPVR
jgi:hypothetical protein